MEDYDFQENTTKELMPIFKAQNKDFTLTLYNSDYFKMNKKEIEKKFGESSEKFGESSEKFGDRVLNDTQIEILRLIKGDEKISAATIAKRMNITKRAVEKSIKDLKVKGILIKFGSARGGSWKVKE
ncbi:helix-turn-helix domain-containing protein [Kandleria vitulina]|uniref:helix-turn-helix domain-containing protein n=1 Tax=Kandleria vitulina TaxID=1630 RepID=UPI001930F692|nr:helix-turn-helix domain-containing protein [Kandleria vitulina]